LRRKRITLFNKNGDDKKILKRATIGGGAFQGTMGRNERGELERNTTKCPQDERRRGKEKKQRRFINPVGAPSVL